MYNLTSSIARITLLTLCLSLLIITHSTIQAVNVNVHHNVFVSLNEQLLNKMERIFWHSGQLLGASFLGYHFFIEGRRLFSPAAVQPRSKAATCCLLACSIPAIFTLTDNGINGFKNIFMQKERLPQRVKNKMGTLLHNIKHY